MGACVCSVMSGSVTPWPVAHQAPLYMGFSRQEYWSGLPFSPPGDLPDPETEPTSPGSPALQVDSLPLNQQGSLNSLYRWNNKGTQKLRNVSKITQLGYGRPMMRTKPFSFRVCVLTCQVSEILWHLEGSSNTYSVRKNSIYSNNKMLCMQNEVYLRWMCDLQLELNSCE